MADYYTSLSLEFEVNAEEKAWLDYEITMMQLAETHDDAAALAKEAGMEYPPADYEGHVAETVYEGDGYWSFTHEFETDEEGNTSIWIASDEGPDVELLALLLVDFTKRFDRTVGFEWANTCSKLRTDGFGGGACIVHKGESRWMNTTDWLEQQGKMIELDEDAWLKGKSK